MKLVARKPMTYNTRRLVAGDVFEAVSARDARLLRAIRKADPHVEPIAPDEAAALRAEYEKTFGKKPFMGWDADTLRQKIAAGTPLA